MLQAARHVGQRAVGAAAVVQAGLIAADWTRFAMKNRSDTFVTRCEWAVSTAAGLTSTASGAALVRHCGGRPILGAGFMMTPSFYAAVALRETLVLGRCTQPLMYEAAACAATNVPMLLLLPPSLRCLLAVPMLLPQVSAAYVGEAALRQADLRELPQLDVAHAADSLFAGAARAQLNTLVEAAPTLHRLQRAVRANAEELARGLATDREGGECSSHPPPPGGNSSGSSSSQALATAGPPSLAALAVSPRLLHDNGILETEVDGGSTSGAVAADDRHLGQGGVPPADAQVESGAHPELPLTSVTAVARLRAAYKHARRRALLAASSTVGAVKEAGLRATLRTATGVCTIATQTGWLPGPPPLGLVGSCDGYDGGVRGEQGAERGSGRQDMEDLLPGPGPRFRRPSANLVIS